MSAVVWLSFSSSVRQVVDVGTVFGEGCVPSRLSTPYVLTLEPVVLAFEMMQAMVAPDSFEEWVLGNMRRVDEQGESIRRPKAQAMRTRLRSSPAAAIEMERRSRGVQPRRARPPRRIDGSLHMPRVSMVNAMTQGYQRFSPTPEQ